MRERIPPHSDDAERSVLGAALLSRDAMYEAMGLIKSNHFYKEAHREIFDAMLQLNLKSQPVDAVTVSEELKKRRTLEMVGGRAYIAVLSSDVPSTANVGEYAKIVLEKAILRNLISASSEIMERSFAEKTDANQVLDFSEQQILSIAQEGQSNDYFSIAGVIETNLNKVEQAMSSGGGITGLPTGFTDLDRYTGGLQRSDLIILAARPSMGKTAFALNIALQTALSQNATVLVFSIEMDKTQLGERLLAMESRLDIAKIKRGELEDMEYADLANAAQSLSRANIFIDDNSAISIMEMKNKCRRLKAEKGLDLVVIDYLQLMSLDERTENRQNEISKISRSLKQLAREMECPVIVLSQLSRAPEQRSSHEPMLSDLRESGSIEQDADIVLMMYRDEYYNKEKSKSKGVCDVIIAKHRNGATGKISLAWLDRCTRFGNLSKLDGTLDVPIAQNEGASPFESEEYEDFGAPPQESQEQTRLGTNLIDEQSLDDLPF